ncbi:hypothetical protein N665_0289s0033 [Sinapis alba]|nr:hypothetical protein N665_0289s0033 [Sinapis alba]
MILRESAVVVLRNQEVAVVGFGELPAEVAKMAADYSGRPVVVEVSCSKQVMAEECNVRPEVEAESDLCKVAEENILALVKVVGMDSDKPVVVVSAVVEVTRNVAAVVVSCNSKGMAVGVKIEVATASKEVVEEGECSKLEIAVAVREMVVVAVMEMAAVGSMSAAEVEVVMKDNMLAAVVMEESVLPTAEGMEESNLSTAEGMEESDLPTVEVMEENNLPTVVVMEESNLLMAVVLEESNLLTVVVKEESDLSMAVVKEESDLSTAVVKEESKPESEEGMGLHPED